MKAKIRKIMTVVDETLSEQGQEVSPPIRRAAATRLRPVLMTSAATVFGHVMLIFVTGPGAAARNSIGWVLVVGMAVGSLFTLFAVPAFYMLIARDHSAAARRTEPAAPGQAPSVVPVP